jgi:hypothetical protein
MGRGRDRPAQVLQLTIGHPSPHGSSSSISENPQGEEKADGGILGLGVALYLLCLPPATSRNSPHGHEDGNINSH